MQATPQAAYLLLPALKSCSVCHIGKWEGHKMCVVQSSTAQSTFNQQLNARACGSNGGSGGASYHHFCQAGAQGGKKELVNVSLAYSVCQRLALLMYCSPYLTASAMRAVRTPSSCSPAFDGFCCARGGTLTFAPVTSSTSRFLAPSLPMMNGNTYTKGAKVGSGQHLGEMIFDR